MDERFTWTVDVESDFGGRTNGKNWKGGLSIILKAFKKYNVKGLFFISTELDGLEGIINDIVSQGHKIGSHGHFHEKFKARFRAEADKELSKNILQKFVDYPITYRAPKFNYNDGNLYADKKHHIGLLKYAWFGGKIDEDTVFYIHPFDIIGGSNPPNLFCKIWYSNPRKAFSVFKRLLDVQRNSHARV